MEKSKNTAYLNELLKRKTAAKYPFLELTSMMLAVMMICIQTYTSSIKQPSLRTYAELNVIDDENEHLYVDEKTLRNQKMPAE